MKKIIISIILTLSFVVFAKTWQIIGQTQHCEKTIQIEAKVGDGNVHVLLDNKKYTLFPKGNFVFMKASPFKLTFDSYNRREKQKENPRFIYVHPSSSMKPVGEIEFHQSEKVLKCKVMLKK